MIAPAQPICLPPAPVNGGRLEDAPAKVGAWEWQPKIDDWRAVLHVPSGTLWNQDGKLSSVTAKFSSAILFFQERLRVEWLDVGLMENRHDLMRGCIVVLDLIDRVLPFFERRRILECYCFPTLPYDIPTLLSTSGGQVRDRVYLISQWPMCSRGTTRSRTPMDLYNRLKHDNDAIGHKFYEGLVAKKANSLYPFNQRAKVETGSWIKHRFDQQ